MRHRELLIASLVGTLALAGCADDDPDTAQTDPEPTATQTLTERSESPPETGTVTESEATESPTGSDVSAMTFVTCEADDYTVGHPEEWNTNDPDGAVDACRVFHPGEVDVEPHGEDLHWAASVYVDAVPYEDARDSEPQGEVLEERELTVAGHDAFFREVVSDGAALVPEGETSATYIVDLDGEILVATTSTIGDTDYERDKEILERMVTEELALTAG